MSCEWAHRTNLEDFWHFSISNLCHNFSSLKYRSAKLSKPQEISAYFRAAVSIGIWTKLLKDILFKGEDNLIFPFSLLSHIPSFQRYLWKKALNEIWNYGEIFSFFSNDTLWKLSLCFTEGFELLYFPYRDLAWMGKTFPE